MKVGLIGKNLDHSYSKLIHQKMYCPNYHLYPISDIQDVFKLNLDAFNITIPYKEDIIDYLDQVDHVAKKTRSVNTVVKRDNQWFGYNSDYDGFSELIKHYQVNLKAKNIVILGNGATSRTIAYYLQKQAIGSLIKLVRHVRSDDEDSLHHQTHYKDTHIIINTTPVGMFPHQDDKMLINLRNFPKCEWVIDVVYNPFRTKLLIEAENQHIKTINGLYMLLMQAKKSEEIFFNKTIQKPLIQSIHHQLIYQYVNIVLIGMPFSGKSTYGKLLSKNLFRPWYDTDDIVESYTQLKVSRVFKLMGEKKFRQLETDAIRSIYHHQGSIISCGGGVILKHRNMQMLKQNGFIIYINKQIDDISISDFESRPLIKQREDLKTLFNKRHHLYQEYADVQMTIDDKHPFSLERLKKLIYEYFDH